MYERAARSSAGSTCSSTTPASTRPTTARCSRPTLEAWQRVQDVNVRSVFLCCKHGIPHLLDGGGGSVINTASFVAVMGAAVSQISYTASKGAVLSMSRELGVEFAQRGVRVNALCPGPVNTPLLQELFAKDPEKAARRLVHLPMGRFAEAEEIAQGALFLASDESSYVTASTFMVDGGLSGAYLTPGVALARSRKRPQSARPELVPGRDLPRGLGPQRLGVEPHRDRVGVAAAVRRSTCRRRRPRPRRGTGSPRRARRPGRPGRQPALPASSVAPGGGSAS